MDKNVIRQWIQNGDTASAIYEVADRLEKENEEEIKRIKAEKEKIFNAKTDILNAYNTYNKIITGNDLSAEVAQKIAADIDLRFGKAVKDRVSTIEKKETRKAGVSDENKAFAEAVQRLLKNW